MHLLIVAFYILTFLFMEKEIQYVIFFDWEKHSYQVWLGFNGEKISKISRERNAFFLHNEEDEIFAEIVGNSYQISYVSHKKKEFKLHLL